MLIRVEKPGYFDRLVSFGIGLLMLGASFLEAIWRRLEAGADNLTTTMRLWSQLRILPTQCAADSKRLLELEMRCKSQRLTLIAFAGQVARIPKLEKQCAELQKLVDSMTETWLKQGRCEDVDGGTFAVSSEEYAAVKGEISTRTPLPLLTAVDNDLVVAGLDENYD